MSTYTVFLQQKEASGCLSFNEAKPPCMHKHIVVDAVYIISVLGWKLYTQIIKESDVRNPLPMHKAGQPLPGSVLGGQCV